jgi:peroxiredoxin
VASVPEIKELIKRYPPEKFAVVSISGDQNEEKWRDFIEKKNMTWLHVFDRDKAIIRSFSVNSFPTYLVINGEGIIQEQIVGTNPMQSVAYRLKDKLKNMPELQSK